MYLGKLVEVGPGNDIYDRPAHPYTAGLLEAIPVPNPEIAGEQSGKVGRPRRAALAPPPALGLPLPHPLPAAPRISAPRRPRSCARSAPDISPPATSRCSRPLIAH